MMMIHQIKRCILYVTYFLKHRIISAHLLIYYQAFEL